MKVNTIKYTLAKKHADWVKSIKDEQVRKMARLHTYFTGGCIVSLLESTEVNDYDVYCLDVETAKAIAEYYVNQATVGTLDRVDIQEREDYAGVRIYIKSKGVIGDLQNNEEREAEPSNRLDIAKYVQGQRYYPICITDNAITLSDGIQIIMRFAGQPSYVHQFFDFVHCTMYYLPDEGELHTPSAALLSMQTRELVYMGSKYPICSLFRIRKFLKRDFTVNAGQLLKMAYQISLLDLHDIEVLQDQLIGVDSAYMLDLIASLKDGDSDITYEYMMECISKIFDTAELS